MSFGSGFPNCAPPAELFKIRPAPEVENHPFLLEQFLLEQARTHRAPGIDDPLPGHGRGHVMRPQRGQGPAYGAGRAGRSDHPSHLAVGHCPAARNPPYDPIDAGKEVFGCIRPAPVSGQCSASCFLIPTGKRGRRPRGTGRKWRARRAGRGGCRSRRGRR
jgi:hypothetical protein